MRFANSARSFVQLSAITIRDCRFIRVQSARYEPNQGERGILFFGAVNSDTALILNQKMKSMGTEQDTKWILKHPTNAPQTTQST